MVAQWEPNLRAENHRTNWRKNLAEYNIACFEEPLHPKIMPATGV